MKNSQFDCCKHFPYSEKRIIVLEDKDGKKIQWLVSKAFADKIEALKERGLEITLEK